MKTNIPTKEVLIRSQQNARSAHMRSILLVLFVSLLTTIGFPLDGQAQDISCTGALTGTFGNVVVPPGASCTLSGASVGGDVRIAQGSVLTVTSPGLSVIAGNVQAEHCQSVLLTGAVVVQGNVKIQHCAGTSGYVGPGVQITGDFECHDNTGPCVADQGSVAGNLHVHNNQATSAADISLTTIGGNLQCDQNDPAPTDTLGTNKIVGNALGQCGSDLGFSLQILPATTSQISLTGGTLTTPQGDQLIVPPGALGAPATLSLRPVLRDEVEVALESNAFDGQKLTLVAAVDIETGGPSFHAPVSLLVPNATGLPLATQVLVARITTNVAGDGAPHLVLVDTASVAGGVIQDGNLLLPGITQPGSYTLLQVNPNTQYTLVAGTVQTPTGAPSINAVVWNSGSPDILAMSDILGHFVTAVPVQPENTVFVGANSTLTQFDVQVLATPLGSPLLHASRNLPQAQDAARDALCAGKQSAVEQALNQVKDQLTNLFKNFLLPEHIADTVQPSTIGIGQSATATPDVAGFIAKLNGLSPEFKPAIKLGEPITGINLVAAAAQPIVGAQFQSATVGLFPVDPTIASVTPNGNVFFQVPPTFSVLGLNIGTTNVEGELIASTIKVQLQLETETSAGADCPNVVATPQLSISPSFDITPVAIDPVAVIVQQSQPVRVTFGLGADDFGSLSIGGQAVCTYDNIFAAGGCNGSVNMVPGVWYDISIDYKNRAGSDGMSLAWDQPGPAIIGYGSIANTLAPNLVPLANLQTSTANGFVSGLTGQYFTLSGSPVSTAVGEGPIDAINNIYNNQVVGSWNGFGFFSLFEERLTGQIRLK
jgi:hypothetical protein